MNMGASLLRVAHDMQHNTPWGWKFVGPAEKNSQKPEKKFDSRKKMVDTADVDHRLAGDHAIQWSLGLDFCLCEDFCATLVEADARAQRDN